MKKSTRTFIFGLIMFIICCTAVAVHLTNIKNGEWDNNFINYFLMTSSVVVAIIGMHEISKTID